MREEVEFQGILRRPHLPPAPGYAREAPSSSRAREKTQYQRDWAIPPVGWTKPKTRGRNPIHLISLLLSRPCLTVAYFLLWGGQNALKYENWVPEIYWWLNSFGPTPSLRLSFWNNPSNNIRQHSEIIIVINVNELDIIIRSSGWGSAIWAIGCEIAWYGGTFSGRSQAIVASVLSQVEVMWEIPQSPGLTHVKNLQMQGNITDLH